MELCIHVLVYTKDQRCMSAVSWNVSHHASERDVHKLLHFTAQQDNNTAIRSHEHASQIWDKALGGNSRN
jgi:hypothetical protein